MWYSQRHTQRAWERERWIGVSKPIHRNKKKTIIIIKKPKIQLCTIQYCEAVHMQRQCKCPIRFSLILFISLCTLLLLLNWNRNEKKKEIRMCCWMDDSVFFASFFLTRSDCIQYKFLLPFYSHWCRRNCCYIYVCKKIKQYNSEYSWLAFNVNCFLASARCQCNTTRLQYIMC